MTPKEQCEALQKLDKEYGTKPNSPLHHDNRCMFHKKKGNTK